jgi:acetyltransferase-like isoleucine patch superfamily enzyme
LKKAEIPWHSPDNFFSLEDSHPLKGFFSGCRYAWEILDRLPSFIGDSLRPNVAGIRKNFDILASPVALSGGEWYRDISYEMTEGGGGFCVYRDGQRLEGASLLLPGCFLADDMIEIGPGVLVEPGAMIKGPAIIGERTEVRQGAYVRGQVMTMPDCVIGHATEAKCALFLDGAKAGHFAYVGDSLLGREVNLGAGTKLANLKMLSSPYRFAVDGEKIEVDRRKFGAIMGDGTETGCNSVTSPGTLMGQRAIVLPNATVKGGYYPRRFVYR